MSGISPLETLRGTSGAPSIRSGSPALSVTTPANSGDPPSPRSGCSRPTIESTRRVDDRELCEAELYLREKGNSTKVLVAMCIGLMDEGGTNPLIDLTQHPWTALGKKNIQPLNTDLIAGIHCRWNKNFASVDGGDFPPQGPRPSQWKTPS